MAATTYTTDLGIKKIGTGLEAGTWGASTNQNWERLSDAISRPVTLDITAMPTGSTSSNGGATPTDATWLLLNASDSDGTSSDAGAEGRCSAVEFTDTTTPLSTVGTILIRGNTSATSPQRTLVVWNNLTSENLKIDCAGGEYNIRNGFYALIQLNPDGIGGWSGGVAGVQNLLSNPQMENAMITENGGALTFDNPGHIIFPATNSAALAMADAGGNEIMVFDTSANRIVFNDAASTENKLVLAGASGTEVGTLVVPNADALALLVEDVAANEIFTVDTTNSEVHTGSTGHGMDARVWGNILIDDASRDIVVPDAADPALQILSTDATEYLNILSSATAADRRLDVKVPIEAPDIMLTGTDGYLNGTTTQGSTGYGLRNNAGQMEIKSSTGDWTEAWNSEQVSGTGTYFEATHTTLAVSTDHTEAHGLGAVPRMFTVNFICTSADAGYQIGDEVPANGLLQPHDGNEATVAYADATNIGFMTGSAFRGTLAHRTGGAATNMDITKWDLIMRGWK